MGRPGDDIGGGKLLEHVHGIAGDSVLMMLAALPSLMLLLAAMAASGMAPGDDAGMDTVWCSHTAK